MNAAEVRNCPACGSRDVVSSQISTAKRAIGGRPLEIIRCRCGALFQPRVPTFDELSQWYEYMGHNPANVQRSPLLDRRLDRLVRPFEHDRSTGRLLEIGCGGGLFVRAATARGWEVWGTEVSSSCAALLRPLMQERLHEGSLETAPFEHESFDGAAMIEVIEHLPDPLAYLVEVRRFLRPGGRLLLTTPNGRGSAERVLGSRWRAIGDEHLALFDPASVPVLLARAGFTDVGVTTTNLDLLVLAASRLRGLLAARRNSSAEAAVATAPSRGVSDAPTPRQQLRAMLIDAAIEAVNQVANATRFGDTLKVTARRA